MRVQCHVTDVWDNVPAAICSVRQGILSWPCPTCDRVHVTNAKADVTAALGAGAFDDKYGAEVNDPRRHATVLLTERYVLLWAGRLLTVPSQEIVHRAKFQRRVAS